MSISDRFLAISDHFYHFTAISDQFLPFPDNDQIPDHFVDHPFPGHFIPSPRRFPDHFRPFHRTFQTTCRTFPHHFPTITVPFPGISDPFFHFLTNCWPFADRFPAIWDVFFTISGHSLTIWRPFCRPIMTISWPVFSTIWDHFFPFPDHFFQFPDRLRLFPGYFWPFPDPLFFTTSDHFLAISRPFQACHRPFPTVAWPFLDHFSPFLGHFTTIISGPFLTTAWPFQTLFVDHFVAIFWPFCGHFLTFFAIWDHFRAISDQIPTISWQDMAIFGLKSDYYGRLVGEWGISSGKCLVCHIISLYMTKHELGPF